MSGRPPIPIDARFGAGAARAAGPAAGSVVFGRRKRPPTQDAAFRKAQLDMLGAELTLLFSNRDEIDAPLFVVASGDEPRLHLGRDARLSITIDPDTGMYVLHESGDGYDCMTITGSEARLLDQVVSCVASRSAERISRTADTVIDVLVGRSVEEVERSLVLRTLLRFRGDYHGAAAVLGITHDALRQHIRRHLATAQRVPSPMGDGP